MATMPSCPAGRRGGVSGEVFREEEAMCYVKKVKPAHSTVLSKNHLTDKVCEIVFHLQVLVT